MNRILEFSPSQEEAVVSRILVLVHQAVDEHFPAAARPNRQFTKTVFSDEKTANLKAQEDSAPFGNELETKGQGGFGSNEDTSPGGVPHDPSGGPIVPPPPTLTPAPPARRGAGAASKPAPPVGAKPAAPDSGKPAVSGSTKAAAPAVARPPAPPTHKPAPPSAGKPMPPPPGHGQKEGGSGGPGAELGDRGGERGSERSESKSERDEQGRDELFASGGERDLGNEDVERDLDLSERSERGERDPGGKGERTDGRGERESEGRVERSAERGSERSERDRGSERNKREGEGRSERGSERGDRGGERGERGGRRGRHGERENDRDEPTDTATPVKLPQPPDGRRPPEADSAEASARPTRLESSMTGMDLVEGPDWVTRITLALLLAGLLLLAYVLFA